MNSRTVDSKDLLDFLSLPVKRICTLSNNNLPLEIINFRSDFYKGFCKNNTLAVDTVERPSKSQATTQNKRVVPQLNHIPLKIETRPTVRVTVIPRKDQTQNRKLHKKRIRYPPKRYPQNTASHEGNFLQSQGIYCAVTDRRKETIYDVRSTESATFSNPQSHVDGDEGTHITRVSNIKQLIRSLNMDQSKRKYKSELNNRTTKPYIPPKYKILNERACINDALSPATSQVRIYGEFGLNEDDKYVLKYGATVNNKPVMADVTKVWDNNKPDVTKHKIERRHRDSGHQAKLCDDCPVKVNLMAGKGTQSTQVNFKINLSNTRDLASDTVTKMADKITQCNCHNIGKHATDNFEDEEVLERQSPLLIISVYPKPQTVEQIRPEKVPAESNKQRGLRARQDPKSNAPRRQIQIGNSQIKRVPALDKKADNLTCRSRSPSPSPRNEIHARKTLADRSKANNVMRESKRPTSLTKALQARIQEKDNVRKTTNPPKPRAPSPMSLGSRRQITHKKASMSKAKEIGVNTDHLETKKALVEKFTKTVSSALQPKQTYENDTSKITINIDGAKEFYDVLLNRNKRTTGVSIRKTMKDVGSQKSAGCRKQGSDSLENFICMSNGNEKNGSVSMSFDNNPSETISAHVSRLTIRDSLEICHRRDRPCQSIKNMQTSTRSVREKTVNNFLAPIKHFTGDDCCILNPVARDREIRQLLGVDSLRLSTSKAQQIFGHERFANISYNYVYGDCSKDLVNNMNICPSNTASAQLFSIPLCHSKVNDSRRKEMASVCQQVVLNRNVQVFLQVEQFTKQKPIVLTKQQYERVRRTIQKTISKNLTYHRRKYYQRRSDVSMGEVKIKTKSVDLDCDKEVQTALVRNVKIMHNGKKIMNKKDTTKYNANNECQRLEGNKTVIDKAVDCIGLLPGKFAKETEQKDALPIWKPTSNIDEQFETKTYVHKTHLFDYDYEEGNRDSRRTVSSFEVHYANVAYEKCVKFSSSEKSMSNARLEKKASFMTLFRGHRKTPTPNLGTSDFSLESEETDDNRVKVLMRPREPQTRKPLLKRLMSCLVMRSTRDSNQKLLKVPKPKIKAVESSVDSYYINTSVAAVEVSSSIYDTSASFYSNHTIYPVNSKMKRGFFSSVRGFLSNRKS